MTLMSTLSAERRGLENRFPRCQQVPRLTTGASFALVASQACVPTCPEYMSPCPKPFDVAAWCGDTNCQLDMQPAQCAEFLGCRARRGQKLSIPISRFYASLDAYDLKLSLSSAGCSGVAVAPEEFIVQLDGVAGTPSSLHYANEAVFTWAPFPEAPTVLALTDLFVEKRRGGAQVVEALRGRARPRLLESFIRAAGLH